jgi:DNA polymerase I-like protein with 3'-5' exonuclease and polymerase domains
MAEIYAADCETSGLLDMLYKQENPKLHNFCAVPIDGDEVHLFEGTQKFELQEWLDEGPTLIIHNGKLFDEPAMEYLGYDLSKCKIIDSLALSWYLEPTRMKHGLGTYGTEFGIEKPEIEDFENQTQEEYNHRVIEDTKIQKRLWQRQVARLQELYGKEQGSFDRIVAFLMFKMDCLRKQQDNKWKLDIPAAQALQAQLAAEIEEKTIGLRDVMPKSPVYAVRKKPAKPFLMNGELSSIGEKWKELTASLNLPFEHTADIKVITSYNEGNPGSHTQIKSWLDSLGWIAETFKFIREDDGTTRQIPQINLKDGDICQSVKDLIPKCTGIEYIAGLGILNHRHGMVKGWLRDGAAGAITARAQGFTNTLRLQHKEYCNTPSTRVKWGKEIRSLLVARGGKILLGSDLSGVEDRLKQSFMWRIDEAYVRTQMEAGFDPHLSTAASAGLMTWEEVELYKAIKTKDKVDLTEQDKEDYKRLDLVRAAGKSTNYACQYSAGVKTIARTAKVSEKVAKKLHDGYWKLNWAVRKIATMTTVKKTTFGDWQFNPINKFWYSLRNEKDRFSTLIQGTGAYVFDIWLYQCIQLAKKRGLEFKMLAQQHDDVAIELDDGKQEEYEKLMRDGIERVNQTVKLNRLLDCDVIFGYSGSEIH